MREADLIAALRRLPLHPGARGLADDAAQLGRYTLTTDTIVAGVHFLADADPADVAWRLVATNLSDLAAKGAIPEGVLLNLPLTGAAWMQGFVAGLGVALEAFAVPILGGDTVSLPAGAPLVLSLTAIGRDGAAPPRSGASAGDALFVTGSIGDAGAGLAIARGGAGPEALARAYLRPVPRLAEGRALAPQAHAMMDVSDGLLIDAARMAEAAGLAVAIDLAAVPRSPALVRFAGDGRAARLAAATAGDDYELLFAAPPGLPLPVPATRIGGFSTGSGLHLTDDGESIALPESLGWQHRAG